MKERLIWLDNLKGLAILLVILGHCIQDNYIDGIWGGVYQIIYSFHMPLFMALSGYCSPQRFLDLKAFAKKRFIRLLIPYLFWGVVAVLLYRYPLASIFNDPDKHLWFLWDLFFISLIVYISNAIFPEKKRIAYLIATSIVVLLLGYLLPKNIFNLKSICWMFQFYVFGCFLKAYDEDLNRICKRRIRIFILLISFVLVISNIYVKRIISNQVVLYGYNMIIAYMGIVFFFVSFISVFNHNSPLVRVGQASLGIYAIHQFIINAIEIGNIWLEFIVVFSLSVLFVLILRKTKYLTILIGETS